MERRILTISKPYVGSVYRHKLAIIAKISDFKMGLICPPAWGNQVFETGSPDIDRFLWIRKCPIRLNGHNHFHIYREITRLIDEFHPDLINCEEEHYSAVTFQIARLARSRSIPITFYTWQNIYKNYPPPFSQFEKYLFRHAAAGICGNQEAEMILRKKGYKNTTAIIPQMGVNCTQFTPVARTKKISLKHTFGLKNQRYIGFIGRLVPEKGLQDFLMIMPEIPGISLIIIGDGPYEKNLRLIVNHLNLNERVTFVGQVKSSQVAAYMQTLDFLILPSQTGRTWKEQFGRVLIEAMATGVIPIGSTSGEIPLVIGKAGIIFREKDSKDLKRKIENVIKQKETQSMLQSRCITRARHLFSNEIIAQKFVELFNFLLDQNQNSSQ